MTLRRARIAGLLASVCLLLNTLAYGVDEPVQLTSGQVSGIESDGVQAFLGIPFAAPPVGDLRWQAPQAPIPWEGVRVSDRHAPACMQRRASYMSEDCLYLNVWTSAETAAEQLPVMVWIHGGAFIIGSGSSPMYDGVEFADRNVVLVSINYRLGALGFLRLTDLTNGERLEVDAATVERVPGVEITYINWVLETDGVFENRKWRVDIGHMTL